MDVGGPGELGKDVYVTKVVGGTKTQVLSEVKQENPYKFSMVISPPGFNPFMTWIHASFESFIFLDLVL